MYKRCYLYLREQQEEATTAYGSLITNKREPDQTSFGIIFFSLECIKYTISYKSLSLVYSILLRRDVIGFDGHLGHLL